MKIFRVSPGRKPRGKSKTWKQPQKEKSPMGFSLPENTVSAEQLFAGREFQGLGPATETARLLKSSVFVLSMIIL